MELKFKELIRDIYTLMDPRNIEGFFRNLKLKPVNEMLSYLFILGLFTFLGYFLRHTFFLPPKYPLIAMKLSFLYYFIGVYVPTGIFSIFIMAYILHSLGGKLVKREVSKEESVSLLGYSAIPELIGGFFGILLETWVLHVLLMVYSIYLLYVGMKVRFGFKLSIRCFIFVITSGFIVSMLLFVIGAALLGIPRQYYGV